MVFSSCHQFAPRKGIFGYVQGAAILLRRKQGIFRYLHEGGIRRISGAGWHPVLCRVVFVCSALLSLVVSPGISRGIFRDTDQFGTCVSAFARTAGSDSLRAASYIQTLPLCRAVIQVYSGISMRHPCGSHGNKNAVGVHVCIGPIGIFNLNVVLALVRPLYP